MSKTIEITLYEYDELDEKAQAVARDWFMEASVGDEWWENLFDDAKIIGLEITQFDLDRRSINGKLKLSKEGVCEAILKNHGKSCDTFELALNPPEDEDEFLRLLLNMYFVMLRNEYKYINSEEWIVENIHCNEYTFLKNGERFG